MAIPDFQTLMLPVLRFIGSNTDCRSEDLRNELAREFALTYEELSELLPSKRQGRFRNRVAWALTYLGQARLIQPIHRSTYRITDRGRELLLEPPDRITISHLMKYPEFAAFRNKLRHENAGSDAVEIADERELPANETPDELIAQAYGKLNEALTVDLLDKMLSMNPFQFEQLVLDVLMAMGYGGQADDAGYVTKRSGDEGIDAVINQDPLGLDVVYVQAKRWSNSIGRPEIQSFVGALAGKQANKGIFITTSDFAKSALDYAHTVQQKIVLINGKRLAQLMIANNVGVTTQVTYSVKGIDSDYFDS